MSATFPARILGLHLFFFFLDPRVGSGDFCEAISKSSGCVLSGGMRCYSYVHILFILIVTLSSSCLHSCSVACCFKKKGLVLCVILEACTSYYCEEFFSYSVSMGQVQLIL